MKNKPLWLKLTIAAGLVAGGLATGGVLPVWLAAVAPAVSTAAALFHEPPKKKKKGANDDQ